MRISFICYVLLFAFAVQAGPIESLKAGEWYEVPNSHLYDVRPSGYSANVMDPWSGGAFDTKRNNLIVWGGGHGDYVGNEVYVFSLDSLKWFRLNAPSNPPAVDVAYAADGGPCSRHTYEYVEYMPGIDRFCSFGGAGFWQSGQTGTAHTDCFDFDSLKWTAYADVPERAHSIGAFAAVDPVTGHAWQHGAGGKMLILAELDPVANAWTAHSGMWTEGENDFSYGLTAAIDPVRRRFVAVGTGVVWNWPLDSSAAQYAGSMMQTTGDTEIINTNSPGLEYDPISDKFVAWSGGADVYLLDMDTRVWTKQAPAATNAVTPTAAAQWGTFGRFRYCPQKNVFVTVNRTGENIFIYRLTDSIPPAGSKLTLPVVQHAQAIRLEPSPGNGSSALTLSGSDGTSAVKSSS